tara:strand:+ start:74 stop:4000 length:3927 start_codon:yes stop_codon:yes gene_type:complete
MTQQTRNINLSAFEAGDRPTDQDFRNLFDSILFLNETNGLDSNNTTHLGDFNIGGSLQIIGGGSISISGSFSVGNPNEGFTQGAISAFTSTTTPPFFASSSVATNLFTGISYGLSSSIQLSSDNDASSFVRWGIATGQGFLDAHGTSVINYSTGSSFNTGGDNIVHMSASVGIGTTSPSHKLTVESSTDTLASFKTTDAGPTHITIDTSAANTNTDSAILFKENNTIKGAVGYDAGNDTIVLTYNTSIDSAKGINIISDGKVGLNQKLPTEQLHIEGTTTDTRAMVKTTTGGAIFKTKTDNSDFSLIGLGATNAFNIHDASTNTTPFKIAGGTLDNTLFLNSTGVGVGTASPGKKLSIVGDMVLRNDADDTNIILFNNDNDVSTTPTIRFQGNALLSSNNDFYINIDDVGGSTTRKFVIGHDTTTTGATELFKVEENGTATATAFVGDGSGITGITSAQIALFTGNIVENNLVTINSATTGLDGEANLKYNGTDLIFGGTPTVAFIRFPTIADTGGSFPIRNTAIRFPGTDDRALIDYGFTANDEYEIRLVLQDGNADKFKIISDEVNSSYTALDINGNRALFFSDNSAGKVGIGVTPTAILHAKSTAADSVTGLFEGAEDGILHVNAGSIGTVGSNDAVIRFQRQGNSKWGLITKADDGLRIYDYASTADHTFFETGGNVGIGTTDPTVKLDVRGDIKIADSAGQTAITLFSGGASSLAPDIQFNSKGLVAADLSLNLNINSNNTSGTNDLFIRTGGDTNTATELMRVTSDSKLGLGGVDPGNDGIHVYKNNGDGIDANDKKCQLLLENAHASGDVGMKFLSSEGTDHNWALFIDHSEDNFKIRNLVTTTTFFTMENASSKIGVFNSSPDRALDVTGTFRATGNATLGGTLTLTGNADFNGDLDVDGTTNLDAVDIDGAVNMATTLTLTGNADFNGNLDVDGTTNLDATNFGGNVNFGDNDITNVDSFDADKLSIAGGTEMTSIKDEDDMASDSNVALATQQSIKAYVDNQVGSSGGDDLNLVGNLAVSGQTAGTTHPEFGGQIMAVDATDENIGCDVIYWNPDGRAASNGSTYSWRGIQGSFGGSVASRLGFQGGKDTVAASTAKYFTYGGSGTAFTGQHPCKPNRSLSIYQSKVGYIVSSVGTISNHPENWFDEETGEYDSSNLNKVTIDESIPIVELSEEPNDKKVYGVISQVDDPNSRKRNNTSQTGGFNTYTSDRIDDRMAINSVGEGAVMVSNINGNLKNGDYITTSHIEGIGMKQDDDLLHNYTVAKIIEDCDFASGTTNVTHNGVTYKLKLVGCTYHCG